MTYNTYIGGENGRNWKPRPQAYGGADSSPGGADLGANTGTGHPTETTYHGASYPVESAGIRAGEIIAFRCWNVVGPESFFSLSGLLSGFKNPLLSSTGVAFIWKPHLNRRAVNLACDPDEAMYNRWEEGGGGYYSFETHKDCAFQFGGFANKDNIRVFGQVHLWGVVVEHERGFRSEYAAIKSLDRIEVSPWKEDVTKWRLPFLLKQLRGIYGV